MKGRYSGGHMTIYGTIIPMATGIARSSFLTSSLTERAKYKLKVIDWWKNHNKNTSLTSRHLGLGKSTVNRWVKSWKKLGILGLNEKSKRPKRLRTPVTPFETIMRIVELRKKYKAWSKYKIGAMIRGEGVNVSNSTIGRILKRKNLSVIETMRDKIQEWEDIWNNIRPHAALNYLTPNEYLERFKENGIKRKEIISLQA